MALSLKALNPSLLVYPGLTCSNDEDNWGAWVAQLVKRLPSAQVMILESPDGVTPVAKALRRWWFRGTWVAQLVGRLPSAQVMIPESWDRVPHRAPSSTGSLLLSLTFSSLMLSLTVSLSNK